MPPRTDGSALAAPPRRSAARSLRVLYVWDADYPWDVRTEKVCAALAAAGHDVHIVARNRAQRPLVERLPEGTVHRMRPWRRAGRRLDTLLGFPAFFSPRWSGLIQQTVRAVRPDVILVRDVPLCPTAIRAARRAGVPVMLDMAEHYPAMMQLIFDAGRQRPVDYLARNPRAVSAVERWCLPRLDGVLVVVEEMAERLAHMGVPRERITVVSNTPPLARAMAGPARSARASALRASEAPPRAADDWPRPDAPLRIVYLGLLEVARGIAELVDATALLRDRGMPVHTTIVGAGRDAELFHARAARHGLTERDIEFPGFVAHARALDIVGEADVGVVPHHAGAFWNTTVPNKLFDYMAAGLPVVCSDAVPCARIVRAAGAGEVHRSRDSEALADAIARLADPAVRRACGRAGQLAVRSRHHWERDAAALLAAVERAAARDAERVRP